MTNVARTSEELVRAREWIENCLDGLNDAMAATNTSLVNAIETLIRAIVAEGDK